jgi:AcrR family transcriptional regulator
MNQAEGTRSELLRSAINVFARNGFSGASVRAITREAGANLGAVTYHFGSKQRLYEAVIESLVTPVAARLQEASGAEGSPLDRAQNVVRQLLETVGNRPQLAAIVLHELSLDRPLPEAARRWIETLYGTLIGLVQEGQRAGDIVPGDPRLLAASVLSQPFYLVMARRPLAEVAGIRGEDPATREHVAAAVRRILAAPGRRS